MTPAQHARLVVTASTAILALLGAPAIARGQAWVPSQGEGSVSIQVQNALTLDHYFTTTKGDIGPIHTTGIVVDASYGLSDKVAVDVSLPYIASKYTGPKPHPTALDDGTYHSTFQDFRFALRYNVRGGRFALTPYVGSIVPSHDYEFYAHAAPGRRLRELQIGTYAARLLDPVLSGMFVQTRVAYGFTERVLDIAHDRVMGDLEVGYFATDNLRVFGLTTGQVTRGGIDIPVAGLRALPLDQQLYHDQIDRVNFLNVGAGASVTLRDSVDLFGSVLTNVANRNGHALNRGMNLGVTFSFKRSGRPSARDAARAEALTDRNAEAQSLLRCICQRGER